MNSNIKEAIWSYAKDTEGKLRRTEGSTGGKENLT